MNDYDGFIQLLVEIRLLCFGGNMFWEDALFWGNIMF
jgi:hypothetical protein